MRRSLLVGIGLFVALVGCDHATKAVAESELRGRPPAQVIGGVLDLEYHQNRGIAFNLERFLPEPARTPLLVAAGLAVMFVLAVAWRRRRAEIPGEIIAYSLVAAGAVGNVLDRILRGYVVDFIHVRYWPVFNVADALLVIGVGLLLWQGAPRARPAQA